MEKASWGRGGGGVVRGKGMGENTNRERERDERVILNVAVGNGRQDTCSICERVRSFNDPVPFIFRRTLLKMQ